MTFAEKLKELMRQNGLNQTKLCLLTGIGVSSISQYLSGKNEPNAQRKRELATALGVEPGYFEEPLPEPEISAAGLNVPVTTIARLMGKSPDWVYKGLQQGVFPWGYAVKLKSWSYFISATKFTESTGIAIEQHGASNEA